MKKYKEEIAKLIYSHSKNVATSWVSKACAINNLQLTERLMKEVLKENLYLRVYHDKKENRLKIRKVELI